MLSATIPDLLRLVVFPVFAWAAWRDVQTRRVPNQTWLPLAALGILLLAWDGFVAWTSPYPFEWRLFAISTAVSVGFVVPLAYAFWRLGGFGGADAKAFMVLAVLLPTFPAYPVADWVLPLYHTPIGAFSFSVLTNTVLAGACYPLALAVRNAVAGRISAVMVVGYPVHWSDIPMTHGRLLETPAGFTRSGLDLDALRMYLRWRDETLESVRDRETDLRDPATLPDETHDPGDGAVATDGGHPDDPWGAAAFLDAVDHNAYGTTADDLRTGLDVLSANDDIWVSPGIPFLVPLFVGLVAAFTYGDVLFGFLASLGFA